MVAWLEGFDDVCNHPYNDFLFATVDLQTATGTLEAKSQLIPIQQLQLLAFHKMSLCKWMNGLPLFHWMVVFLLLVLEINTVCAMHYKFCGNNAMFQEKASCWFLTYLLEL